MLELHEFRARFLDGKNLCELHRTRRRLERKVARMEKRESRRRLPAPSPKLSLCRRYLGETEFELFLREFA